MNQKLCLRRSSNSLQIIVLTIFSALTGSISGNLERALERAGGSGWNYAGQAMYWPETHPFCGGKRQSPIDFDTSQVFDVPSTVKPVDFRYTYFFKQSLTFIGHYFGKSCLH